MWIFLFGGSIASDSGAFRGTLPGLDNPLINGIDAKIGGHFGMIPTEIQRAHLMALLRLFYVSLGGCLLSLLSTGGKTHRTDVRGRFNFHPRRFTGIMFQIRCGNLDAPI